MRLAARAPAPAHAPRRALATTAVVVALALVVPAASAREADPYPKVFTDLLDDLVQESEARGKASENASWYPQAATYLQKAKDAQADGRFRLVLFDLETYEELVVSHRLNDTIAPFTSEGERKAKVLSATHAYREEMESRWSGYRAKLHRYDGKVQSLRTVENVVYASDIALTAVVGAAYYDELAQEFPKQPTTDIGYIQALVRASHNPSLVLDWTSRMLDAVVGDAEEGLPPLANQTNLTLLVREAILVSFAEQSGLPPTIAKFEERLQPARDNREGFMALAGIFAEKRADRLSQMQTQFGDARARRNVVEDADRFMGKELNNTSVSKPQAYGLGGVFSADAVDRALYAHELISAGLGDLTTILVGWSALDGAHYAEEILQTLSTVKPAPTPDRAPFLAPASLAVAAAVALALSRRSR